MLGQTSCITFGTLLKAFRLGFAGIDPDRNKYFDPGYYARAYEVSTNRALIEVCSVESLARHLRKQRPENCFLWEGSAEFEEKLRRFIQKNEKILSTEGRVSFEVTLPTA